MKLTVAKQEDRDALCVILARNGYTVRQGKEKPQGAKVPVNYVEVITGGEFHDDAGASKLDALEKRVEAVEHWIHSQPTVESVAKGVYDRLLEKRQAGRAVVADENTTAPPADSIGDTSAAD